MAIESHFPLSRMYLCGGEAHDHSQGFKICKKRSRMWRNHFLHVTWSGISSKAFEIERGRHGWGLRAPRFLGRWCRSHCDSVSLINVLFIDVASSLNRLLSSFGALKMEWYSPFAVCIVIVSCFALTAILLLRKFEGAKESHNEDPSLAGVVPVGYLSRFELWSACGGALNPSWLLLYRGLCVIYLLPILTYNVVNKGGFVFLFYTECTFLLLAVYFALAFRQSFLHWLRPRGESITHQHHRLLNDDVEADDKSVVASDLGYATHLLQL